MDVQSYVTSSQDGETPFRGWFEEVRMREVAMGSLARSLRLPDGPDVAGKIGPPEWGHVSEAASDVAEAERYESPD